jgi:3-dehydroquinate synthase
MIVQRVELAEKGYDILIDEGLTEKFGALIAERLSPSGAVAVVADSGVWAHCGEAFSDSLRRAGVGFSLAALPPGERSKSLDGLAGLYAAFADMKLRRDGLVIAFGGGVTGDLGGFAAATWMRGVRYIQIPTTLLAQVDSSVGGKTAVNLDAGKNLAGVFYQPRLVLIDTEVTRSLPPREFRCGMAEVIKYGAIRSKPLFEQLARVPETGELSGIISLCCRIKSDIVQADEFDTGERMLLNFGHTLGHAVEKLGGFKRYNHGEAVAIGMRLAAEAGEKAGLTPPGCARALRELLAIHGLDTACPYPPDAVLPQLALDKKSENDGVRLVLLSGIGAAFTRAFAFDELKRVLTWDT